MPKDAQGRLISNIVGSLKHRDAFRNFRSSISRRQILLTEGAWPRDSAWISPKIAGTIKGASATD